MRADRLLSILLLLQVYHRMTARELAKRLEVSERTIHRDMDALSTAGIPVIAERGSSGGWSLLEEYSTNLTGLTEAEIQALFLTKPTRLLADLGLHQASEAAFIKLLAALPSMSRRDAEYVHSAFISMLPVGIIQRKMFHASLRCKRRSGRNASYLSSINEAIAPLWSAW